MGWKYWPETGMVTEEDYGITLFSIRDEGGSDDFDSVVKLIVDANNKRYEKISIDWIGGSPTNEAMYKSIMKNIELLTRHCPQCRKFKECEEQYARGEHDYESRYCDSIIKAACYNHLDFEIPFP